ncbi:MAG TPA: D-alanine--D-alanine ligase [Candidatus Binatia bacterium]|nr:D-alanine--D-alanine ligase [Candidatus Binatia bacterium]
MKVLVLLGGDSPEREVSLRSGEAVSDALRAGGHEVYEYDPKHGYDGLSEFKNKVDVVLPIIHGVNGEDGVLQKELEARGFKFLGADSVSSALCFDKTAIKQILNKLSILTPRSEIVDKDSFSSSSIKASGRYVLKPIKGGSTIDASIVNDSTDDADAKIFDKYPTMLLEELIVGNEITVPVLDGKALPVIEIIPPTGEDFDYENKYNGETQELCPPVNVSQKLQAEAQQIAERLHAAAGIRHLSRTDIIIDKDDKLWVLEINTMPGMTSQSLFPKSAKVAGISMTELVERFSRMAIKS